MSEVVKIFDMSYEGAGVGKLDGQIVFVPKTLPSEEVEIEVVKKTNSFLIAKAVDVLSPSEKRIAPKCPYFSICGGCDFQHCSYETEKLFKQQILAKEMRKIGFECDIEFQPSATRFAYRNKIKFEVCGGKIGYYKAKSHTFFEVKTCPIASEKIDNAVPKIAKFVGENLFKTLKNVYIKQVDEDIAVCFLFEKNSKNVQKNVKNMQLLEDFSVFFAFGEVLESNETQLVYVSGKKNLFKRYANFFAETKVGAFNQVNDDVAEKLYDFVIENAVGKRAINAYSGQGVLTRQIAQVAKFAYGIELQKSAHESAQKLTQNLQNVKNLCGKVEEKLCDVLRCDCIDLIVLDPAREGCKKEVLQQILDSNISSVICVYCNFATLTRDLQILKQKYEVERVKIFDMFPCTANLETVAILKAK